MLLASSAKTGFYSTAHLHVLLNHLPVTGLAMAILALALALKHQSRKAEMIALILVFISAASALPVVFTGQQAYKTVRGITDDEGTDWLDMHMERAETVAPAFYALTALSLAALALPYKWPRAAGPLAAATLALAALCLGAGGWVASAGGQIRHPEFRSPIAPRPSLEMANP